MSSVGTDVATVPVLAVQDLTVRFGGVVALYDVDLALDETEVCGLIGPNGAGKTTLLDCISGVRAPSSGRVVLDGRDVTHASAANRARRGIRRTYQRVQLFDGLTVEDNVLIALEWRGGGGGVLADLVGARSRRRIEAARRERVGEVLEMCGLLDDANAAAGSLPFGRARVLELARALVDPPRVLLLDEPTSGLDDESAEMLADVLDRLRTAHPCAVVLVEHDMAFVTKHCDRLVVLSLGSVLADGPVHDVRARDEVVDAYLGSTA